MDVLLHALYIKFKSNLDKKLYDHITVFVARASNYFVCLSMSIYNQDHPSVSCLQISLYLCPSLRAYLFFFLCGMKSFVKTRVPGQFPCFKACALACTPPAPPRLPLLRFDLFLHVTPPSTSPPVLFSRLLVSCASARFCPEFTLTSSSLLPDGVLYGSRKRE